MKNKVPAVARGTFKIIRVDGSEEICGPVSLKTIYEAIGCSTIDTVTLTWSAFVPEIVMCVDDTGMIDNKPINPKATALYHSICKPGTPYSIHGDVAIVNDADF